MRSVCQLDSQINMFADSCIEVMQNHNHHTVTSHLLRLAHTRQRGRPVSWFIACLTCGLSQTPGCPLKVYGVKDASIGEVPVREGWVFFFLFVLCCFMSRAA